MKTFKLTSPSMHGARDLQHAINSHLRLWGAPQNALLAADGAFGPRTRLRAHEVAYGLGISQHALADGITPYVQGMIFDSRKRNPTQVRRGRLRTHWRKRFIRRISGGGAGQAVDFAKRMARKGIVEHPMGSNSGPYITQWEKLAGYNGPVFWCGCFVNACLVAGGMHTQAAWGIGYVPSIESHAKGGHDGWKWHGPDASPHSGWIATFGQPIGDHTEFVVEPGGPLRTVGGNTSAGNGSPNNGGGVYAHNFATYHGLPLRGFAEPNYS